MVSPYTPFQCEDIFAEDWQIFGKGVLGTGMLKLVIINEWAIKLAVYCYLSYGWLLFSSEDLYTAIKQPLADFETDIAELSKRNKSITTRVNDLSAAAERVHRKQARITGR